MKLRDFFLNNLVFVVGWIGIICICIGIIDSILEFPFLSNWRLIILILGLGCILFSVGGLLIASLLDKLDYKLYYKKEYGTVIQADEKKARDTPDGRPKFTITIELDSGVAVQAKSFRFQCDPDTPREPFRVGERVIVGYWTDIKKIVEVRSARKEAKAWELEDQLKELKEQVGRGVITQEEYEQKKNKLLGKSSVSENKGNA